MNKILILILALLGIHAATGKPYVRDDGYTEDKERYADLLADPYAARYLDFFLDPENYHAMYKRTEGEKLKNGLWYLEQGEKAFPILLEVIRREEGNLGANRIDHALSKLLSHPGDKSAFVEEVRRRLPEWRNAGFTQDLYNNMVTMSFGLLAAAGDESDIALMQSILDPERRVHQDQIDNYSRKLITRLEKEKKRPDKRESRESISLPGQGNQRKTAVNVGEGKTADAPRKTPWILLAIALLLPLLVLSIRRAKR